MSKQKVVFIRGIPGTGKTTLAETYARKGFVHCENDHYFMKKGVFKFEKEDQPKAIAACADKFEAAVLAGKSVVISNTFLKVIYMRRYIGLAEQVGAKISIIDMLTFYGSTHPIPEDAMQSMAAAWEPYDGPYKAYPSKAKRKSKEKANELA